MSNPVTNVSKAELFNIISIYTGVSSEELFLDSSIGSVFRGNEHKLGVALYDLHELTDKSVDYSEDDLSTKFKTIQDVATYFELD